MRSRTLKLRNQPIAGFCPGGTLAEFECTNPNAAKPHRFICGIGRTSLRNSTSPNLSLTALGTFCALLFAGWLECCGQPINPFPRPIINTDKLAEWTFRNDVAGWSALHDCSITATPGALRITSTGNDPYLASPALNVPGPVVVKLRAKCATAGAGQIFWMTSDAPSTTEARSQHFPLIHDGQWHDYEVSLQARGTITRLRLDPGEASGPVELENVQLSRVTLHPLEILSVSTQGHMAELALTNHTPDAVECSIGQTQVTMAGHSARQVQVVLPGKEPFGLHSIEVLTKGLTSLHRRVFLTDTNAPAKWVRLGAGNLALRLDADGSGARIELDGNLVGFLAPLITQEGTLPKLKLARRSNAVRLSGTGVEVNVSVAENRINVDIRSSVPCEGPVLRALGLLEQGLFAGVEYLARGESSSSMLDIETEEHIRFAPDPLKVTMPLMAFVTDRATTALTWRDMGLQPVFATPNFLDGAEGHRAALRGTRIEATILVTRPQPLEQAILWAVRERGLPPLPPPPRPSESQLDFCLKTLNGPPLKTEAGWGHCAESSWERHPFADHASTIWRLSGKAPELPHLVPGGSHLRNDAIYFVTGRAQEWLKIRSDRAQSIISEQQPDGSFRYHGKYQRGHFEDTASGYCAPKAFELLETARLLGNPAARAAGLKALDFIRHFRDPRGAQTWECPLHTPDILASAYLVQAYVLGYELTGKIEYLERARAWAITGLPFVYQWGSRPIMPYATIAVFGATEWRAPNWMGLPVQWCGYDYAYGLTQLAPLDRTLDWNLIARGILIAAEQMQYPEGEFAGCVPDSFNLAQQHRNGPAINPCALVSLRLVLEGRLDSLACATAEGHRVVAPFPTVIREGKAQIQAQAGVSYQVVVDGRQILEVKSKGLDIIDLGGVQ